MLSGVGVMGTSCVFCSDATSLTNLWNSEQIQQDPFPLTVLSLFKIYCLPRSPDLKPMHWFLHDHFEDIVFEHSLWTCQEEIHLHIFSTKNVYWIYTYKEYQIFIVIYAHSFKKKINKQLKSKRKLIFFLILFLITH